MAILSGAVLDRARESSAVPGPIHLHLWPDRSLFLGVIPDPVEFTPACACLLVGLDLPFHIAVDDGPMVSTPLALVPPGVEVRYYSESGLLGCCFLDVLCRDYRMLAPRLRTLSDNLLGDDGPFAAAVVESFRRLYLDPVDPAGVYDNLVDSLSLPSAAPEGRIEQAVAGVVASVRMTAAANLPNSYYATEAGLSEEVLSRWFRQQTGLTLRRYRNWHRLFLSAWMMQQGISLTDAAQEAGFSDAAHFTHVFREMVGLKPSFIQRAMAYTRIYFAGMLAMEGEAVGRAGREPS
ncbi:MAG TPA: helix-turn-helix domain-containing protein [Fluviicoccus sp.]|nr:helix-turn-helix domain-containing protein [Fluviicoccus sp.]